MKKVFLLVVVGITLLAIPATVYLVGKNQELRKRAAPATTLAFSPATISVKEGETFTLEAQINTGENQVVGAQINVVFDPDKLEAISITNGPLAPNILASGVVEGGTASITVSGASQASPITGQGIVAVLTMKALQTSPTAISVRFSSDTFLGALGESTTNVLIGTTPATVTILNADGSQPTDEADTGSTDTSGVGGTSFDSTSGSSEPTPTPTLADGAGGDESLEGDQATTSTLSIITPGNEESVDTTTPVISGTSAPGVAITLTIYSDAETIVVTADADGNWTYTPTSPLANGPHSVVALATDELGGTQTATTNFVVAAGGGVGGEESTESAMPIAGNTQPVIILLCVSAVFIVLGALVPAFIP